MGQVVCCTHSSGLGTHHGCTRESAVDACSRPNQCNTVTVRETCKHCLTLSAMVWHCQGQREPIPLWRETVVPTESYMPYMQQQPCYSWQGVCLPCLWTRAIHPRMQYVQVTTQQPVNSNTFRHNASTAKYFVRPTLATLGVWSGQHGLLAAEQMQQRTHNSTRIHHCT